MHQAAKRGTKGKTGEVVELPGAKGEKAVQDLMNQSFGKDRYDTTTRKLTPQEQATRRQLTEQMAAEHNKVVQRKRVADEFVKSRAKPRVVDETLQAERSLGLGKPFVDPKGFVGERIPSGGYVLTNPVTGRTVVRLGTGQELQFQTRTEALQFMTKGPQ